MTSRSTSSKIPRGETREHILNVASMLFYYKGIQAIGVNTIVAEAGVAKTTLYDHFPSKEALIEAYLEARDAAFWQDFEATLQRHPDDPVQQLRDLFADFEAMITAPESLGCPFLSAAAEFPELDQPGHQVVLAHKQAVRARLEALAAAAGIPAAGQLAEQLLLLLDGAFAAKRVFRSADSPARQLSATAAMLLDLHMASR